jgi:hypothetical protein
MLSDIDRISADAAGDGLADYSALQDILGDTQEVKDMFARWWQVFPTMEATAKQFLSSRSAGDRDKFFVEYDKFIEATKKNNTVFLELCIEGYKKFLH